MVRVVWRDLSVPSLKVTECVSEMGLSQAENVIANVIVKCFALGLAEMCGTAGFRLSF